MSSNESAAYEIMRSLDVDYVLIIFGGVIGYSGDDINKFLWMVRIAEGEHPKDIRVSTGNCPEIHFNKMRIIYCSGVAAAQELQRVVQASLNSTPPVHIVRGKTLIPPCL